MTQTERLLTGAGIAKSFGGTLVLDRVDFQLSAGEIHGLVGENGAGKSTLLKIFIGVHQPDAGDMRLLDAPFHPHNPREAQARGISLVPQELKIVPRMSIADNVMLGRWVSHRSGSVKRRELEQRAREDLGRIGLHVDPRREIGSLSFAERQLVVIARALSLNARVLILDEPTASLERVDVDRLFLLLDELKRAQVGVIFVSHRLDEIKRISDVVTVLRDGKVVAHHQQGSYTENDLIKGMIGRTVELVANRATRPAGATLFAADVEAEAGRQSLALRAHRNTGLAGLLGSGAGRLLQRLFGTDGAIEVEVKGKPTSFASPRSAIANGVGYVPSERASALFGNLSVRDNIILPHLDRFGSANVDAVNRMVSNAITLLDIRPKDPGITVSALSGGNQQKVIFARWIIGSFHTLLLDEPTHGIDIAAKAQILRHLNDFVSAGNAVLLASTEFHELLAVSDEIVVIRNGKVAETLSRDTKEFSELHLRSVLGG